MPFTGAHQAGIATPAQDRLTMAAFDVVTPTLTDVVAMLKTWTAAAVLMVQGQPIGDVAVSPLAPAVDTGEAYGLAAGNLTLTVGFGPSFFDARFGLADGGPPPWPTCPRSPATSSTQT